MASADLDEDDRRPALRPLICHVKEMLEDIERALVETQTSRDGAPGA